MFDWIIEADIHRRKKEATEQYDPLKRRRLQELAEQKMHMIGSRARRV